MPDQVAQEEQAEDPAVQLDPAELAGHDRHRRGDGQRLEGDEGDRQDEPEGQAPAGRRKRPPSTAEGAADPAVLPSGMGQDGSASDRRATTAWVSVQPAARIARQPDPDLVAGERHVARPDAGQAQPTARGPPSRRIAVARVSAPNRTTS